MSYYLHTRPERFEISEADYKRIYVVLADYDHDSLIEFDPLDCEHTTIALPANRIDFLSYQKPKDCEEFLDLLVTLDKDELPKHKKSRWTKDDGLCVYVDSRGWKCGQPVEALIHRELFRSGANAHAFVPKIIP